MIKILQLIWRLDIWRLNLWVTDLQMNCCNLMTEKYDGNPRIGRLIDIQFNLVQHKIHR